MPDLAPSSPPVTLARAIVMVVLLVLVTGTSTDSAEGSVRSFKAGTYQPIAGPLWSGQSAVWATSRSSSYSREREFRILQRAGTTEVIRSRRAPSGSLLELHLAASPASVLSQEATILPAPSQAGGDTIGSSGAYGRTNSSPAFRRLGPGCYGGLTSCPRNVDVDGSLALLPNPDGAPPFEAQLIDLNSGSLLRRLPDVGSNPSLAGSRAAWVSGNAARPLIVYDSSAGRELYRIPGPVGNLVDVQSDGTVAYITSDGSVAWASVAEPYAHLVAQANGRPLVSLRLVGGTLIFARETRSGVGDKPIYGASLRGQPRQLVSGSTGPADFDGERVLWPERSCGGARIASESLAKLMRRLARRGSRCALRLRHRLRSARNGTVTVTPDCRGFQYRCLIGPLSVRSGATYRVGATRLKRGAQVATTSKTSPMGTRLRLRLSRTARRVLRQRSILVRLRATVRDDTGGGETRAARILVRRTR